LPFPAGKLVEQNHLQANNQNHGAMKRKIIKQSGNIRLIKSAGKYSVQARVGFLWWKKWKSISFGPWYPRHPGWTRFSFYEIAEDLYNKCLPGGEYTQKHLHWKRGI
jgi:hypothetical protein